MVNFLNKVAIVKLNYSNVELLEDSLENKESVLGPNGQVWVITGEFTGRAANDKYLVDNLTDVTFGPAGEPILQNQMDLLEITVDGYLQGKPVYVTDFIAGGKNCRLISRFAWHALFVKTLFTTNQVEHQEDCIDLTIVNVPNCYADPDLHGTKTKTFIACDFKKGLVLIGGTHYAGEIKKSVFSYLAYVNPEIGILPMHSSVTVQYEPGWIENPTVFFGLSGTGKTTLSADERGKLLGDDEHLWSDEGITNIESGCYAKAINLSKETEPLIWDACHQFLTILENVVMSDARVLDFNDKTLSENSRAAYSLNKIKNSLPLGTIVKHPKNIIMLTCDAFGVLPSVAKLSNLSAAYHFISGYTAKIAGTEKGLTEPKAAFSACFGAPFMAKNVNIYADLLIKKLEQHQVDVWLVNTGWLGGGPGVGKRMDINKTRECVQMIISGQMKNFDLKRNYTFNLSVPSGILGDDPEFYWQNKDEYQKTALELVKKFNENSKKYNMVPEILSSGMPWKI